MEKKINIAELLKDCPKGMELDCSLYEDVYFEGINENLSFPIVVNIKCEGETWTKSITLTNEGKLGKHPNAKCVIFPKGKTTWEGFQRPFKDGDIVFYNDTIAIFKEWGDETLFRTYVAKYLCCESFIDIKVPLFGKSIRKEARLATEEEKQKLFDAIKANGYKWNAETKTLEELVEPKFKVGDIVQDKDGYKVKIFNVNIEDKCYGYESLAVNGIGGISFDRQDDWELVPDKFNIKTLKPFYQVLVRDNDDQMWTADMFSFYNEKNIYPFACVGHYVNQCIPYEGNEHLLGTTNDCEDYYKTWE